METTEKYRIKELLKKAQVVKGRNLTKPERREVVGGYIAMQKLGIFNKPEFKGNRKLLDKHY